MHSYSKCLAHVPSYSLPNPFAWLRESKKNSSNVIDGEIGLQSDLFKAVMNICTTDHTSIWKFTDLFLDFLKRSPIWRDNWASCLEFWCKCYCWCQWILHQVQMIMWYNTLNFHWFGFFKLTLLEVHKWFAPLYKGIFICNIFLEVTSGNICIKKQLGFAVWIFESCLCIF